jgi:hypothetical protein
LTTSEQAKRSLIVINISFYLADSLLSVTCFYPLRKIIILCSDVVFIVSAHF